MRIPSAAKASLSVDGLHSPDLERVINHAGRGLLSSAMSLVKRDSSSSSNCTPGDSSGECQKYTSTTDDQTLPIVLGVVIPLGVAFLVCIYLHRRYLKRQRAEDLNDPHKSLDFGMDVAGLKGGRRAIPEMTASDLGMGGRPTRGVSMDMTLGSPYLLSAELNSSRNSIHSMSRSVHDEHDPYRPVNLLHRPSNDVDSLHSPRPRHDDKLSLYSSTTSNEKAGLIAHARPMSQSFPKLNESETPHDSASSDGTHSPDDSAPQSRVTSLSEKHFAETTQRERHSHPPPVPELQLPTDPSEHTTTVNPPLPRKDSLSSEAENENRRSSYYGEEDALDMPGAAITITEPVSESHDTPYDIDPAMIYTGDALPSPASVGPAPSPALSAPVALPEHGQRLSVVATGNRLSVMGVRPLPPDVPDDNPEMRANRIRSFYREYFDDSKPNPEGHYEEEDHDFWDGAIYDPDSGGFFVPGGSDSRPFAQAPGRRAMTPPPRGPPRGSNGSRGMHARKYSTYSTGRHGPRGRPPMPAKKLPPPKPLLGLPTPYLLKNDSEILGSIDFAPPTSFRQQQNGLRPDTPKGMQRPFSPTVRPWTPLQSSFDNLAVMPSPHELRKSGTFTALDFAPPPAIRDHSAPGSDVGSIRSNRSGISAMHIDAVRAGAYRVSRIPRQMVTTREDLASQLRPTLNMVSPA